MKAVIIKEFGGVDKLELAEVKKPDRTEAQILIKVISAGVNPVDAKIKSGKHISRSRLQLPPILGWNMSGIVESFGENVKEFSLHRLIDLHGVREKIVIRLE